MGKKTEAGEDLDEWRVQLSYSSEVIYNWGKRKAVPLRSWINACEARLPLVAIEDDTAVT